MNDGQEAFDRTNLPFDMRDILERMSDFVSSLLNSDMSMTLL